EYEVINEVKVDVLRDFLRVGTFLVPRFVMYAVFFTVFTVYLAIVSFQVYATVPIVYWFISLLTVSTIIFWYETLYAWFSAPST
ncbi:MAG: hypothetical protein QXL89_09440, partial [Nitrososphaeria archaeon]